MGSVGKTRCLALVIALGAFGCGDSAQQGASPAPRYSREEQAAFDAARATCAHDGPQRITEQLGYAAYDDPAVAADFYASELSDDSFYSVSYDGCLRGFEDAGW